MRGKKYHLYLSDRERMFVLENLVWFQNKLHMERRYTVAVDGVILKFSKAKRKKTKVK